MLQGSLVAIVVCNDPFPFEAYHGCRLCTWAGSSTSQASLVFDGWWHNANALIDGYMYGLPYTMQSWLCLSAGYVSQAYKRYMWQSRYTNKVFSLSLTLSIIYITLIWLKERGWALSTADCQRHDGPENERMFYSMYMYYLLRYITFMDTVILALRKVRDDDDSRHNMLTWHVAYIENNPIFPLVSKHGCDPAALVVVTRQMPFRKVNPIHRHDAWFSLPSLSAQLNQFNIIARLQTSFASYNGFDMSTFSADQLVCEHRC